jgi:hypothetical protein
MAYWQKHLPLERRVRALPLRFILFFCEFMRHSNFNEQGDGRRCLSHVREEFLGEMRWRTAKMSWSSRELIRSCSESAPLSQHNCHSRPEIRHFAVWQPRQMPDNRATLRYGASVTRKCVYPQPIDFEAFISQMWPDFALHVGLAAQLPATCASFPMCPLHFLCRRFPHWIFLLALSVIIPRPSFLMYSRGDACCSLQGTSSIFKPAAATTRASAIRKTTSTQPADFCRPCAAPECGGRCKLGPCQ